MQVGKDKRYRRVAIKVGETDEVTPQIIVVQSWFEELSLLAPLSE